uniref:Uncharacterized protein n=1 Tax=Arundo donax TaxID=35708 RepID=A0A0A9GUX4_ARUDO
MHKISFNCYSECVPCCLRTLNFFCRQSK